MDRNLLPLHEITQGMQNWTALVQVLEKHNVQVSKAGNRYQKLIFVDDEGRKVQGLIFGSYINFFRNYFDLYKRYLVSNAKVHPVHQNFSTYENECSWTIDNSTLVQEVEESEPPIIPHIFNFTPFTKFYEHIDSASFIDVAAVVIHTNPITAKGQTSTREVVVVDQSCRPITLTLWGNHEMNEGQAISDMIHTQPIIAGFKLKVSSYHTLNLSTRFGSSILINPPIQEAAPLREWCNNNQDIILKILAERAYEDRLKILPPPEDDVIATIRGMLTMPEKNAFWIQGIPKLMDKSQKLWYHTCPCCHKYIRARPEWLIDCTSCQKRIQVVPRCRLTVQFSDYSGSITLDLYGEDASQLLPFTIKEIQQQESEKNIQHEVIQEAIKKNTLLCLIKKAQSTYASSSSDKYTSLVAHQMTLSKEALEVVCKYTTHYGETAAARKAEIEAQTQITEEPSADRFSTANTEVQQYTPTAEGSSSTNPDPVISPTKQNRNPDTLLTTLKLTESPPKKQKTSHEKKND